MAHLEGKADPVGLQPARSLRRALHVRDDNGRAGGLRHHGRQCPLHRRVRRRRKLGPEHDRLLHGDAAPPRGHREAVRRAGHGKDARQRPVRHRAPGACLEELPTDAPAPECSRLTKLRRPKTLFFRILLLLSSMLIFQVYSRLRWVALHKISVKYEYRYRYEYRYSYRGLGEFPQVV